MQKIDLKKELKHLYKPPAKYIEIVDVPQMNYLMIDGEGDPNTAQSFQEAIEALYSLSYTLKFMIKKGEQQIDYSVMPLEGLWWTDNMSQFSTADKSNWKWTLMIMQPDFINSDLIHIAKTDVRKKKNPVALPKMRFESYTEGKAAQMMYIGPFAEEGPTIEKIHAFIREKGAVLQGKHHEIYLSDFRKTAPEKLKTIIRQPMNEIGE